MLTFFDKVPNTVQILVGQIHKAAPLTHLHQLEPALQAYDTICRQLSDLGHSRADIEHKQGFATYLSVGSEFQYLRDTFNNLHRLDTYAQSKIRAREYILGVAMSKIASKGLNVPQTLHQISKAQLPDQTWNTAPMGYSSTPSSYTPCPPTASPPYPTSAYPPGTSRPYISRIVSCWNCRQKNPGHRTTQCPAPFCRPCMNAGEKVFE